MKKDDLPQALAILDQLAPQALAYEEWLSVGMVLKSAGGTLADWCAWSSRDTERYREREMPAKWASFRVSNGRAVGMGSLVLLARQNGVQVRPPPPRADDAFGWDERVAITGRAKATARPEREDPPEAPMIDERWVESDDIPAPASDWATADTIRYLEAMFGPDEHVGIVADAWQEPDGGRWLPKKGVCDRTRSELVDCIRAEGVACTIGDTQPEAGAWVRINPMDGAGAKDANVTAFRHSLVEADDADLGKQLALIRALQLPVSARVHSGKRSIHALVRVDAANADEYRARVDRLYEVCKANGLKVDGACRNPSRLSRLPGVLRAGQPQYLIETHGGQPSWDAWEAFLAESKDDLPDPESLAETWDSLPPLAMPIIEGILREGHKMRLTGPSKAGKSFSLIELGIAMAEGREWLGMKCRQGAVLYINLELDRASCLHRFHEVYRALGWAPDTISAIEVWNLRGHAVPLDKLAPKLIRRATGRNFSAVIIDPIYKLQWGDENDAGDVARFCNQLDRICHALGAAVIDAHHHSKGTQGQKRSIDRGSGSGVFGRDPDAILDLVELEIEPKRRAAVEDKLAVAALARLAHERRVDWQKIPEEDRAPSDAALLAFGRAFPKLNTEAAQAVYEARQEAARLSGWRLEATLREFATPHPRRVWFRYPVHTPDTWGLLTDAKAAGEEAPWAAAQRSKEEARREKATEAREGTIEAIKAAGGPGHATVADVAEGLGVADKTVRRRIEKLRDYHIEDGVIHQRDRRDKR